MEHTHTEHNHSHHHHHDVRGKNLFITIILNVIITVAQVIGSFVSGSLALLSDALHNFSDVMSLVISWIANKMSKTPPDDKKTFGYKRAEIIAALINAVTLLIIAIFLVKEAISRFGSPVKIESTTVIVLAALSIVLNGASVLLVSKDAKHSMNMRSAYLHLFTDMMTSVAVMIGGIVMSLWNISWIDDVLSIIIAIYLIIVSWRLVIETLKILMQFTPAGIKVHTICEELQTIKHVSNVHHVHTWQLNDNQIHFEAHIDFKENMDLREAGDVLKNIRDILNEKYGITHTTLQPEYKVNDNKSIIVNKPE
ncbi:MAG: cation diffusion facilitator family transporter [Hyphomicrobiales bacterium]